MARVTDFLLDDDDDRVIVNGDWAMASDGPAIKQGVKIRLRFFRGEWFLDEEIGIPYYERILVKNPNISEVREWYRRALQSAPGVREIARLDTEPLVNRQIQILWSVLGDVGLLQGTTESLRVTV